MKQDLAFARELAKYKSRTLKVRGGIISQANRYLGGFCSSQRIFPPQTIQVLLKDQWVALQGKRVVASGKSMREVQEKVARKKITDFAFHYVPSKRLAMAVNLSIHLDAARWFATILEI